MTKKEVIWRDILVQSRQKKTTIFTQKELSDKYGFSLSTVFHALKIPRQAHIIHVSGRNFRLDSYEKLLFLWASYRNLVKDTYHQVLINGGVKEIEAMVPSQAVFGLYSAFSFAYSASPADYDHVYVYLDPVFSAEIKERFTQSMIKRGDPNLFLLTPDPWLKQYETMPPEQIFVDIWNAQEWYAKDFLEALKEKLIS